MKHLCLLVFAMLMAWQCKPKPVPFTNKEVAKVATDFLVATWKPTGYKYTVERSRGEGTDSLTNSVLISPDYAYYMKDTASTDDVGARRIIAVYGASVQPYGADQFLVNCINNEEGGNSPPNSYVLVGVVDGKLKAIKEYRREDFPEMTIKRIKPDETIVAQVLEGAYGLADKDTTYREMIIRGDSLIRGKVVSAADTL